MNKLDYHAIFSRNLRAARKQQNLSQAALAEKAYMSESTIKILELSDTCNPTLETMCLLAVPLQTNPCKLLNPCCTADVNSYDLLIMQLTSTPSDEVKLLVLNSLYKLR